jgi:hypothetical protein
MAKCNRCGATLANSTSRALNIHRARYCLKSGRMKFVPPALRAPKHNSKGKEVQKQPNIDVCLFLQTFTPFVADLNRSRHHN